jgi:hypothetical protein
MICGTNKPALTNNPRPKITATISLMVNFSLTLIAKNLSAVCYQRLNSNTHGN